jgi:hypothetical protein
MPLSRYKRQRAEMMTERFLPIELARARTARIANELAQAGDYPCFAVKVADEHGTEVGKRSS